MGKKKTTPQAAASGAAAGLDADDRVVVRMFCHGLGDCFLLSIPNGDGAAYHVLIDCGVAKHAPNEAINMPDVVDQIRLLTDGSIDLLVVTHEHWDHVSGFVQAKQAFDQLEVRHLWVAWTEDPKDKLAQELRQQYGKAKLALANARAAVARQQARLGTDTLPAVQSGLDGIFSFFGPGDALPAARRTGVRAGATSAGTADAMEYAKKLVAGRGATAVTYLKPGETHGLAAARKSALAGQIKVRVLAPPHDAAAVRRLDSTKETFPKKGDAHFGGVPWGWTVAMNRLLGSLPAFDEEVAMPFEKSCRITFQEARQRDFFGKHYFRGASAASLTEAQQAAIRQRRIDGEWLARGAEQLALWINTYTNNLSLVLAFELPKTGKVLLFVGDAQVGNWLSWHQVTFEDGPGKSRTTPELLAKTVLYKVGHHGSHNATLRANGLELMTHPELVAMLPVDHDQAQALGYGEMPLGSLVKAIKDRADERLLRLDRPWKAGPPPGKWPAPLVAPKLATRSSRGSKGVKYMEYAVRDQ